MTQEELLERIEKAKRDGDTKLDLSNEGLTELPPEIGQVPIGRASLRARIRKAAREGGSRSATVAIFVRTWTI